MTHHDPEKSKKTNAISVMTQVTQGSDLMCVRACVRAFRYMSRACARRKYYVDRLGHLGHSIEINGESQFRWVTYGSLMGHSSDIAGDFGGPS